MDEPATLYVYEYRLGDDQRAPICMAQSAGYEEGDFLRAVRWSPDGSTVAAATDSGALQTFDLSSVVEAYYSSSVAAASDDTGGKEEDAPVAIGLPALSVPHPGGLLDFAWYPFMRRDAAETCCLIESVRDTPVQLRDSLTGCVRASYPARDANEMPMTASALEFINSSEMAMAGSFVAGYPACIARFDVMRPGPPVVRQATTPSRRSSDGVKGVVSCVASRHGLTACASFAGQLGLWASTDLAAVFSWRVPQEYGGAGVTALRWSSDCLLWAAQRHATHIVAWDVRDLRGPVAAVPRASATMQRLAFDFDASGRFLVAGESGSGTLSFHDTADADALPLAKFTAADDVVAAIAAHPFYPLLATASGQRQFNDYLDEPAAPRQLSKQNCLKICREEIILRILHHQPPPATEDGEEDVSSRPEQFLPISSLTICDHVDRIQATEESRGLMTAAKLTRMELPPDLSDYALERDVWGVNFLVAGYPRYKCPYVWLRTDHQRLIAKPSEDSLRGEVEKDVPLRLESIDCWRQFDIRPWDVLVEVICTALAPPPENPFAIDYEYFGKITIEERVVVTGAMLEFLRRVYLRHYFFSDIVLADIKQLQKIHFRDINVLREYQQNTVLRDTSTAVS
ncbi:hypothetical protein H4R26_000182 [Coemansia thaxteri]|uniref:DUF7886 domain-containing protein n=1 Tax=Coemansia thaxteri TaxID=2663907 RepID=A0A9W8BI27_9FUNG|nr:hypothetical protein H4R26_000182 [Coemansia thaxteri]